MQKQKAIEPLNAIQSQSDSEYTKIDSLPTFENESEVPMSRPHSDKIASKTYENPAVWITVLLLAAVGVVASGMHFYKHHYAPSKQAASSTKETLAPALPFDPNIKWETIYKVDTNLLGTKCSKLVTKQSSYTVFSNGTCVRIIEPTSDPVTSAKSTLQIIADPSLPYTVKALDNNNYLIVFNNYVFFWLFAEDIARHKKAIMSDPRLRATPKELKDDSMNPFEHRLGKLARMLVIADSQTLKEKKLIRASSTHTENTPKKAQPAANPVSPKEPSSD